MIRALTKVRPPAFMARPYDHTRAMKELDMFFQEKDPVHVSMRRVAKRLQEAGIPYAVMGGMAVFAHKHRRATNDVDVLVTREGFDEFRRLFVPKNYARGQRPRQFIDRMNRVNVDFLITGRYPGNGDPGPIAFPDPGEMRKKIKAIRYVDLATLVQLKLAARRVKDFADVIALIRENALDEAFLGRIHPSVRRDYLGCLDEMRREDEYERRQDREAREEYGD